MKGDYTGVNVYVRESSPSSNRPVVVCANVLLKLVIVYVCMIDIELVGSS